MVKDKHFDMIYNRKMFANTEYLYEHIFENIKLNNKGEEFRTTIIVSKDRNQFWDVYEGLKRVDGIEVVSNRNGCKESSCEYRYRIPRTNKMSVNKVIMLHYSNGWDIGQLRGSRCSTLIVDADIDFVNNIDSEIWGKCIIPMHCYTKEDNYTDASILIY